jgi:hypothetical protein
VPFFVKEASAITDSKAVTPPATHPSTPGNFLQELRQLALSGLPRMYPGSDGLFAFRVRPTSAGLVREGVSRRYTAITAIGLATESEASAAQLGGITARGLCERLTRDVTEVGNLGDVALTLWACGATGHGDRDAAATRLRQLRPEAALQPTVEVAWALTALCIATDPSLAGLRDDLASRLIASLEGGSVFPHVLQGQRGLRDHVACFADMVYPIQALSLHFRATGHRPSLDAALLAAELICKRQGPAGQWWWHYDRRTGEVVEGYPVYAIHQDSMAPMALLAIQEVSGRDFHEPIARGLAWLASSPELRGLSLVDRAAGIVWRKVGRREPGKLTRYAQAVASGLHPRLRLPLADSLFPPGTIDYEDRPDHLGWVLHAFPADRAARW